MIIKEKRTSVDINGVKWGATMYNATSTLNGQYTLSLQKQKVYKDIDTRSRQDRPLLVNACVYEFSNSDKAQKDYSIKNLQVILSIRDEFILIDPPESLTEFSHSKRF